MATRGLGALLTIPLLTILLVVGSIRLSRYAVVSAMLAPQPDQTVLAFLHAVNSGQTAIATRFVDASTSPLDLERVSGQLHWLYGEPIASTARILTLTPDRAVIQSETRTDQGQLYLINWTLRREGDHWVINGFESLQRLLPVLPRS